MGDNRPIGVIDSGVGGLTVVKELQKKLPKETIIYFGDNKNVPYGNRTEEEIARLTKRMIDFLIEKDVKLVAVACNTISTILDKYFSNYDIPIVSIIRPTVDYVVDSKVKEIGVIATKFTIETGAYDKLIKEKDDSVKIYSEGSPSLAGLIDAGDFTDKEVEDIVDIHMANILSKGDFKNIILGCTHYPIVIDKFIKKAPDIRFVNPAYEQVMYIDSLLLEKNIKGSHEEPVFEIYTTGNKEVYNKMIDVVSIRKPDSIIEL